jgi:hypothetical protein
MGVEGAAPLQICISAAADGMAACMTMDWTEAYDSISSARSAAAIEAVPDRVRIIAGNIDHSHAGAIPWRVERLPRRNRLRAWFSWFSTRPRGLTLAARSL